MHRPLSLLGRVSRAGSFRPASAGWIRIRCFSSTVSVASDSTSQDELARTRNIGIIAHIDAGKTTTTERMLYYSGFTRRLGDVDEGSTVTDFLPAERARGITIQSAAVTFHWPPLPEEQQATAKGSTLLEDTKSTSALPRSLTSHTINLIDTPGHADFTFEVLRSLRILDGAVCILDGVAGVEAQTEKVWHQASVYSIPRIIFVNKLDRDGAGFARTVRQIGARLHGWPAVCHIPWWQGHDQKFVGIGDVVGLRGLKWEEGGDGKTLKLSTLQDLEQTEPAFAEEIKKGRAALVELLSEHDEEMVEKFLEYDEDHLAIPAIELTESLRRCICNESPQQIIPVFAGASFRNIGVQPLLDAVVDLLPEPRERPDAEISLGHRKGGLQQLIDGKMVLEQLLEKDGKKNKKAVGAAKTRAIASVEKFEACALAFKVVNDPRRGVLVYVRVYSGTIHRNAPLYNTNLHVGERPPRLLRMYANDAIEIPSIEAGQIGVIVGLKHARTGDTLISYAGVNPKTGPPAPFNTLQLRPIEVPPPVFFASVEPHSLSEEKNLADTLALLLREDPSLHVSVDEDSGQTHLSGMGELHLEIARDRLIGDYKAKASMGRVEIGYRESILSETHPETIFFDRDIAGKKAKAGCTATVAPLERDLTEAPLPADETSATLLRDGNLITLNIAGLDPASSLLPVEAIKTSLIDGALAALSRGPVHSFPMHSIHVSLELDALAHIFGPDTTPAALSSAARQATQAAIRASLDGAGAAIMEPVMNVVINVDEASLGAVVHDISSARGGQVLSLDTASSSVANPSSGSEASEEDDLPAVDVARIYTPPDPFTSGSAGESLQEGMTSGDRQRNITARVPLKEMVGYLKHLRSLTAGRGTFVMSVDRFERMSGPREKAVLAELSGF
ncbi:ribosome-releasing factor 2 [Xylona heveae TC161]|uniref:Ribosome-releasing factor 2, mitochondrial n=1 Tax=Xylona heveae (strain CBS 132557 / TC161) TaxID=1328760 RepID=A0A165H364_XYLHT|nr:ribosome-releasing factor 2 [Xylona heveae TC161]KZF22923.1 ribosome-releasing factor 2 [Xylona heveae TC161]